jgi:hypothetical protein
METGSMPTQDGVGLYNTNRIKEPTAQPIGTYENQSIDRTEMQPA